MPLTDQQREHLLAALSSRGWQWRDGFIYAPHGTMWLCGSEPWGGDLHDFHERMSSRLQTNEQSEEVYEDKNDHQNLVGDTRGLVEVLAEMLSTQCL